MQRPDLVKDKEAIEILKKFGKLESDLEVLNQLIKESQDKSVRAVLEVPTV